MRQFINPLFGLLIASTIFMSKASVQIDSSNRPAKMYKDCFNDAINRNSVSKMGTSLVFACFQETAHTFYDVLGQYGYSTETLKTNGRTYNVRFTGPSRDDGCFFTN